eukprot:GFKZ01004216.1.p2 GENE.GFKZ01004216.1~~GFKZ01004216.1.p2  ORF type:complete len:103 (-),score=18.89 GFKZ01004216.1:34-342(-)
MSALDAEIESLIRENETELRVMATNPPQHTALAAQCLLVELESVKREFAALKKLDRLAVRKQVRKERKRTLRRRRRRRNKPLAAAADQPLTDTMLGLATLSV